MHRDLKPGNIMITKTGVKLLDFGLAKPLTAAGARPISGASVMATEAQASAPLTERGTILGTFQYMSPEQLEGAEADGRSDIFAFGSVLYEMATGRKAFTGKSQASLIGSILRDDPPSIVEVAPMIPPALNRVVKTCLAKDPEDRFQTAHDAKLQLEWIAEGGSQAGLPAPVVARRKNREKLAWAVAALAALAAVALGFGYWKRTPKPPRTVRFEVPAPTEVSTLDTPKISPDGRILAFDATDSTGRNRIWVRPLNALQAHALAGTEGTKRGFWSPDGKYIAFFAEGKLMKVDVAGGPPQKICDAPTGADGTWSPEGVILFDGTGTDPIRRVPASGGAAVDLIKPADVKSAQVGWPAFLPDGKHFLFLAIASKVTESMYRIGSLDCEGDPAVCPGAVADHVRRARISPLSARSDARRAAVRREDLEDDGRADSPGRAGRHRQRGTGALLRLARRHARVPHRRDDGPARLGGPLGQGDRNGGGSIALRQPESFSGWAPSGFRRRGCPNGEATSGSGI